MAVHNENQHEQTGDHRARPRWSAGKKLDAVLRLLRGEPLEVLSREHDHPWGPNQRWGTDATGLDPGRRLGVGVCLR